MPKSVDGECSVQVFEDDNGLEETDDLIASVSLSEAGVNGDTLNAAVSIVADKDGESTITLVGDVRGKVAFLTVSNVR